MEAYSVRRLCKSDVGLTRPDFPTDLSGAGVTDRRNALTFSNWYLVPRIHPWAFSGLPAPVIPSQGNTFAWLNLPTSPKISI